MNKHSVGQRKGFSPDDYREAVQKRGSLRGAAHELGVDRKTVRDQCIRHEIEVPSINGVPDLLPSEKSD
jgi:hypothetical protein